MTLQEKGPIVPPPVLSTFPQMVSHEIQQWPHIIAATHWDLHNLTKPDGADFYVGEEELGHIHLDGMVHLAAGHALRVALLENNLAKKFPYGGEYADWVQFKIATEADAAHAIWLFELNYARLTYTDATHLLATINNRQQ